MEREFDIAVVGGGPAGAAAALGLARRGWRVAILEATAFTNDREGETLPPEINPVLREMGLWSMFQEIGSLCAPGLVSVWGGATPVETDFVCNPYGPGWHVDRNCFDAMLCGEAVKAGATLFTDRPVRKPIRQNGSWRIGETRARMLVDASGRNSGGLVQPRQTNIDDRLFAGVLRFTTGTEAPQDLRTYIESAPFGWWYTAPVPRRRIVAMFFSDRAALFRGGDWVEELLREAPLTRARLGGAQLSSRRTVPVSSACARTISGEGWLLVGDSASSYDPLSGRGIFKALRQGTAAANALDGSLRGEQNAIAGYEALVRHEFEQYAEQRRTYYAMESRWPAQPFWRKRHGAPG